MKLRKIDLHTHTSKSDGSLSPTNLVRKAAEMGLEAIAVTDHDTTAGIEEAIREGNRCHVEVIPGVEISAQYPTGTLHILGYFVSPQNEILQRKLREYIDARNRRNPLILKRLDQFGYKLAIEEVIQLADGEVINRPHIAQAMVNRGYVRTKQEAFDRFLGYGAPAYIPKEVFTPAQAVETIHQAGGLAVIAHPDQLGFVTLEKTASEIRLLVEFGLDGIEAFHGSCHPEMSKAYNKIAEELRLFVTGGSDYHGDLKHDIELGQVRCLRYVPYKLLDIMKEKLSPHRRITKDSLQYELL